MLQPGTTPRRLGWCHPRDALPAERADAAEQAPGVGVSEDDRPGGAQKRRDNLLQSNLAYRPRVRVTAHRPAPKPAGRWAVGGLLFLPPTRHLGPTLGGPRQARRPSLVLTQFSATLTSSRPLTQVSPMSPNVCYPCLRPKQRRGASPFSGCD